jgi:hypothetical protein
VAARRKPNKVVLATIGVLHIAAAALTWRDLKSRPADQIRGNKAIWRAASAVNTIGSVEYWLLGRRRPRT